jgi:hypothetical protein
MVFGLAALVLAWMHFTQMLFGKEQAVSEQWCCCEIHHHLTSQFFTATMVTYTPLSTTAVVQRTVANSDKIRLLEGVHPVSDLFQLLHAFFCRKLASLLLASSRLCQVSIEPLKKPAPPAHLLQGKPHVMR